MALLVQLRRQLQAGVHAPLGFLVELFRLLEHPQGEVHHGIAVGDRPGGVSVDHQEVLVAALFPDLLAEPLRLFKRRHLVGLHKNGAVAVPFGGLDIEIRLVFNMQHLLPAAHLIPLGENPLGKVNTAKGLHGQKEHQFKGRHLAADGLALQRANKTFPVCHVNTPIFSSSGAK